MASAMVRERVFVLRDRASRRGKDDPEFVRWDAVAADMRSMTNRQLLAKYPREMLSAMSWSERKAISDETVG